MVLGQVMCIAVVISASTLGGPSQGKTPAENLIIDYVGVPNTLEEAVDRSHVIVRARVIGSGYRKHAHPTDNSIADAYTAYSLRILETLKSDSKLPFPDEVLRFGGELVTDKGVQRSVEKGFPKFEVGGEYLLFLFWNAQLGSFHVMFGPNGAFRIMPGKRLGAIGNAVFARRYDGHEPQEVSRRIREIVAARQKK